jgi:hypothetical protein
VVKLLEAELAEVGKEEVNEFLRTEALVGAEGLQQLFEVGRTVQPVEPLVQRFVDFELRGPC